METKLYDKNAITLDGRLDEEVWESAKAHTNFKKLKCVGGEIAPVQTSFQILPCKDRIYIGIKCEDPNIQATLEGSKKRSKWGCDSVEIFLAPSGDTFDFYQFLITLSGGDACQFYSEGGNIRPDPYAPDWKYAVYVGEDFWSVEVEFPLSAFYMTPAAVWNTNWALNVCRTYVSNVDRCQFYTWSELVGGYLEPTNFRSLEGFPMRPACDDIRINSAVVDITNKTDKGFAGTLTVKTTNPESGEFIFISQSAEATDVTLKSGNNEFSVPCCFVDEGRQMVDLQLQRKSDGAVFKREYPVRIAYEPIKLELTLPEFRGNFYPGQDYSKVVGKVITTKNVTVTLEGPGIGKKTVKPDADGNFAIDTPDFEIGDAMLTITDSVDTLTKKIRHLAPSEHRMSWISGGNLVVDGKPVLRRNFYGEYYHGGEAFKRRFDTDNLYVTREITGQKNFITPSRLIKGSDAPGGEATKDQMPSDEMFRRVDAIMDANKDRDFVYYYLEDEPECRAISPVYLKHMYDYITDKDPYHVVLMASRGAGDYIYCTDWVESHAYINVEIRDGKRTYGRPINTMASYIEPVAKQNRPDKCVGFMPTCFAYQYVSIYSVYPNFDEMICHTWAAVLAGAKTLWPYAYHDLNDRAALYEGSRYVFSSFAALEDIVLHAKRTELIHTRQVHSVLYELNDEKMFVLANLVSEPQEVTLDEISGTWYNFRHTGTITGNTFRLEPFEVVIGTSKVRDAGLPTYQETSELIDKLEYERTHTGSLFFDRQYDMIINGTVGNNYYKLFDGIRDNYALEYNGAGKYLEMDISKFKPTFSKLVVGGFQLEDMELKVCVDGDWSVPATKEIKIEEFSKTYIFAEPICPDALRLEFGPHKIELYEIEAF